MNPTIQTYERKLLESMACLIELSDDIIYFLEEDNSEYMRESIQSVAQRLKTLLEEIGAERGKLQTV